MALNSPQLGVIQVVKEIASFEFRNGRFGMNTASLSRVSGGYSVNMGDGNDSFFVRSPVEAKTMFRDAKRYARQREAR